MRCEVTVLCWCCGEFNALAWPCVSRREQSRGALCLIIDGPSLPSLAGLARLESAEWRWWWLVAAGEF